MKETEMGNRGSKSEFTANSVKEQRVDGSWHGFVSPCLRCTLMGFERNYQVKIPSNQINKYRSYSSIAVQQCSTQHLTLDPFFVTGLTDGEEALRLVLLEISK
jgi:hypothetical protein